MNSTVYASTAKKLPHTYLLPTNQWHRLMLQASYDQPFIRHAIMAICGLSRALKMAGRQWIPSSHLLGLSPPRSDFEREIMKCYEFALLHYDKFLAGARGHISLVTEAEGRRTAMIVCLFVVCIEYMQAHHEAAVKQALNGFCLAKGLTCDGDSRTTSLPHFIEDELVQQFNRMETQVMSICDTRGAEAHCRLMHQGSTKIKEMPLAFTNVDEAKVYLESVM
jgi:hypothetical protein